MPKATAVWLVENTALTFDQIADFCGLHKLEVQGIADGEVAVGIRGLDPVASGQLAREEIERCEQDSKSRMTISTPSAKVPTRARRARYTPVSKRQDRPNAISWLLKNYPDLSDAQIGKLLGTTKSTITAVRDRTHWNTQNISPQDPLLLGICTESELLEAVRKAEERKARATARAEREARKAARDAEAATQEAADDSVPSTDDGGAEAATPSEAAAAETPAAGGDFVAPDTSAPAVEDDATRSGTE
jgi:hypothetical protein